LWGTPPKTPNANYDELKGVIAKDLESTVDNNLQISASDLIKFELALRQGNISEERIKKRLSKLTGSSLLKPKKLPL